MEIKPPILLVTPRLLLRAARLEDARLLFIDYTGNDDAARYLQRKAHPSQDKTEAVIRAWGEDHWSSNNRFMWSILSRVDERPIGLFMMFLEKNSAEIHYGLGSAFWGHGLATEAGTAVMNWILRLSGLSEVWTCCAAEHAASLRVLEKIGLSRNALLPQALLLASSGMRVDAWRYSWTRS